MRQSTKRFSSFLLSFVLLLGALIVYFNFIQPAYADLQKARGDEASHAQFVQKEQEVVQKVQLLNFFGPFS